MGEATFRFRGVLEDFIAPHRRGSDLRYAFTGSPAVKDAIEALGVPHPEVGTVAVDGLVVPLSQRLADGSRVEITPPTEPVSAPEPLRFLLDVHLGRLAAYLRMLGFDAAWSNHADDAELARRSAQEQRVLLTRDVGLLKRSEVVHGYWPRETAPVRQLEELVRRFGLGPRAEPFTRCLRCNGQLQAVEKETVLARLPARVAAEQHAFRRCVGCGSVYWRGTHHARMERLIASLGRTDTH